MYLVRDMVLLGFAFCTLQYVLRVIRDHRLGQPRRRRRLSKLGTFGD